MIRKMPCAACGKPGPSDPDHIKTRGSGGGDYLWNLLPLCRTCHIDKHYMGLQKLVKKYPNLIHALDTKGWQFNKSYQRWENINKE